MDEFRQSDEQTAEIEAYETELQMKNQKFRACCMMMVEEIKVTIPKWDGKCSKSISAKAH